MKKITILLLSMTGLAGTSYAVEQKRVSLEILYKASKPVWVAIKNDDKYFTMNGWKEYTPELAKDIVIKYPGEPKDTKGFPYGYEADTGAPTTIALWFTDPGPVEVVYQETGPDAYNPLPNKYWTFTPGRDIFVTLDSSMDIRPQTGTYMGLSGTSASGHSLEHNIKNSDIKPIKF